MLRTVTESGENDDGGDNDGDVLIFARVTTTVMGLSLQGSPRKRLSAAAAATPTRVYQKKT